MGRDRCLPRPVHRDVCVLGTLNVWYSRVRGDFSIPSLNFFLTEHLVLQIGRRPGQRKEVAVHLDPPLCGQEDFYARVGVS